MGGAGIGAGINFAQAYIRALCEDANYDDLLADTIHNTTLTTGFGAAVESDDKITPLEVLDSIAGLGVSAIIGGTVGVGLKYALSSHGAKVQHSRKVELVKAAHPLRSLSNEGISMKGLAGLMILNNSLGNSKAANPASYIVQDFRQAELEALLR